MLDFLAIVLLRFVVVDDEMDVDFLVCVNFLWALSMCRVNYYTSNSPSVVDLLARLCLLARQEMEHPNRHGYSDFAGNEFRF